jgi:hypothetical protein
MARGLLFWSAAQELFFSSLQARPALKEIWEEYRHGNLQKAHQKLAEFQRDSATAESWFLAATLETDGEKSAENLQKALEDPARGEYFRKALAGLSLYYLSTKKYAEVVRLKDRFSSFFEKKSFNPELAYYLSKACRQLGRPETGLKYAEQILNRYPSHPFAGWAAMERGLDLTALKRFGEGTDQFRKLVGRGGGEEVTFALLLLYKNLPASKGKAYAQIYEAKFPAGLGQNALAQTAAPADRRYQIEIGPFGSKSEAQRAFLKLKANSKQAEIASRLLNNRTYYLIRWGAFGSSEEASRAKTSLEKKLKASYSVVEIEE